MILDGLGRGIGNICLLWYDSCMVKAKPKKNEEKIKDTVKSKPRTDAEKSEDMVKSKPKTDTEKADEVKQAVVETVEHVGEEAKKVLEKGHRKAKEHASGVVELVRGQAVLGVAAGLVLGTAATTLVNSLIDNVLMPPLGFILGSSEGLRELYWDLGVTPTGEVAKLNYGIFVSDLINFLVLAVIVYAVVKWLGIEVKKK